MTPDFSIRHLHDLAPCLRDEAGNQEVVGAIMDITERRESVTPAASGVKPHRARCSGQKRPFEFLDTTAAPNLPWKQYLNGFIRTTRLWFKGKSIVQPVTVRIAIWNIGSCCPMVRSSMSTSWPTQRKIRRATSSLSGR